MSGSSWILSGVFVAAALLVLDCSLAAATNGQNGAHLTIGELFGKTLSSLIGQKFEREQDAPPIFKEYALNDTSNDDITHMSIQQIIERSGFATETHRVVAPDGYITQLIRIINPLANQSKLKRPPVMLLQGGISDQSIWIWASAIQHHPEKYPRVEGDGPITSWNRSLGFVLANNGYDVWLVGTRGSNEGNRGHQNLEQHANWLEESLNENNTNLVDVDTKQGGILQRFKYWDYTFEELAFFELPRQIDAVLEMTRSEKVSLVPISLSTMISIICLSVRPAYQKKLHNAVVLAPIINNRGTNRVLGSFHRAFCKNLPTEIGLILFTELIFSQPNRDALLLIAKRKGIRYLFIKALTLAFAGPSSKYQTLLEPGVMSKLLLPTSFKQVQHYCQMVLAARLQKYDYGPIRNNQLYGSPNPERYDTSATDFGNWMVISGGNDMFSTPRSVQQYISTIKTPPAQHIFIKQYNHLDLMAAFDNDIQVNLPVLKFLDRFAVMPAVDADDYHMDSNLI